jgi:hypothetical protein
VQLDDRNKIASGPIDKLSSYAFFGREIYSVANGTVVAMADDRPEQVPGKLPEGIPLQMEEAVAEGRSHRTDCWREPCRIAIAPMIAKVYSVDKIGANAKKTSVER